jgi:hypothetical protein
MPLTIDPTHVEQTIKQIFGDAGSGYRSRHLNARVGLFTKDNIRRALSTIGQYNRFDGDRVADVLFEELDGLIDWERRGCVSVGREGSPVVYIGTHLKTLDTDFETIIQAAFRVGKRTGADEVSAEYQQHDWDGDGEISMPEQPHEVRLWWD